MPTDVLVNLEVVGVAEVVEPEPGVEYENVFEKLYEPEASTYVGKAGVATIYFNAPPEQLPLMDAIVPTITKAVAEHIIANQGSLLKLVIYRATGAWYNSKWKVEITAHGSPFAWSIVIPFICLALIAIAFAFISYQVKDMEWGVGAALGVGLGVGLGLVILLVLFAAGGTPRKEKA